MKKSNKEETETLKTFKGFDKDMKCRGHLFETGKEYNQDGEVKVCNSGYHSCENPLDIFSYYAPADSRFCETEASGKIERHNDDSKICSERIKIGLEISIKNIVEAGIKFIFNKVIFGKDNSTTGDQAGSRATGYRAGSQATGDRAGSQATGDQAGSQATGDRAGSQATGYQAGSQATGDQAGSQATGYQAGSQATGYQAGSQATGDQAGGQATGYRAMSSVNGNFSTTSVSGKESVAMGVGYQNKAKASLGSWIVLAERNDKYEILSIQSVKVDGKKIKADTFYSLVKGKFKIVE